MSKPWDKRKSETDKAYAALQEWLSIPPHKRTKVEMAKRGWEERSVRHWYGRHAWSDRAVAHDKEILDTALSQRNEERERFRQAIIEEVWEAIEVIKDVMKDPDAPPSTRLSAAAHVLDRAGIVIPKRVELTGADGKEIFQRAACALDRLSDEQLAAFAAAFPDNDST